MRLSRYSLFAFATLATMAVMRLGTAIVAVVDRGLAFLFDALGESKPALAGNGGFTGLLVGRPTYDAPPQHELRHEAGTSRRAAARNI